MPRHQSQELLDEEYVLRRIHKSQYDSTSQPAIQRIAFQPRPDEHDGISVYRERYVTAEELERAGLKPGEYYVVRLKMTDLILLGLTVLPADDPHGPPGHAVIPELSIEEHKANKSRTKGLQRKLAELGSREVVVHPIAS